MIASKKMVLLILLLFAGVLHTSIYIIGDSHTREFTRIHGCEIRWLGPILMHRIGRDALNAINLKTMGVEEGATVVYVSGEIDARCHVLKQRDLKNRSIEEIIDTLANNYIQTILINQSQYQNLRSIVYNVVPPTLLGGNNPDFPVYGTIDDRVKVTKELNITLKLLCERNGIHFLDVYDAYAYEDGTLRIELSDGNVHINTGHYLPIQQALREAMASPLK